MKLKDLLPAALLESNADIKVDPSWTLDEKKATMIINFYRRRINWKPRSANSEILRLSKYEVGAAFKKQFAYYYKIHDALMAKKNERANKAKIFDDVTKNPKFEKLFTALNKKLSKHYKKITDIQEKYLNQQRQIAISITSEELEQKFGKRYHNTRDYYKSTYYKYGKSQYPTARWDDFLKKQKEEYIRKEEYKLKKILVKAFESINNIIDMKLADVRSGTAGFDAVFHVTDDKKKLHVIDCEGIYAGGHNIQRLHIRYLTKIKLNVK